MTASPVTGQINQRTAWNPEWERYILFLGNTLLKQHKLDEQDWTIKLIDEDSDGDNAGYCWRRGRVIFLTRDYLMDTDVRNIRETILHEIAHALSDGDHTPIWRRKLKEIGGTGIWYKRDGSLSTFPTED